MVDPDNHGLNEWTEDVKNELKNKFPVNNKLITVPQTNDASFHSTKIHGSSVFKSLRNRPLRQEVLITSVMIPYGT